MSLSLLLILQFIMLSLYIEIDKWRQDLPHPHVLACKLKIALVDITHQLVNEWSRMGGEERKVERLQAI
jgi:hypothetical protein